MLNRLILSVADQTHVHAYTREQIMALVRNPPLPVELTGNQHGSNDVFSSGNQEVDTVLGDALRMFGSSRGGNDTITASDVLHNMYGEAIRMFDSSRGGNDT